MSQQQQQQGYYMPYTFPQAAQPLPAAAAGAPSAPDMGAFFNKAMSALAAPAPAPAPADLAALFGKAFSSFAAPPPPPPAPAPQADMVSLLGKMMAGFVGAMSQSQQQVAPMAVEVKTEVKADKISSEDQLRIDLADIDKATVEGVKDFFVGPCKREPEEVKNKKKLKQHKSSSGSDDEDDNHSQAAARVSFIGKFHHLFDGWTKKQKGAMRQLHTYAEEYNRNQFRKLVNKLKTTGAEAQAVAMTKILEAADAKTNIFSVMSEHKELIKQHKLMEATPLAVRLVNSQNVKIYKVMLKAAIQDKPYPEQEVLKIEAEMAAPAAPKKSIGVKRSHEEAQATDSSKSEDSKESNKKAKKVKKDGAKDKTIEELQALVTKWFQWGMQVRAANNTQNAARLQHLFARLPVTPHELSVMPKELLMTEMQQQQKKDDEEDEKVHNVEDEEDEASVSSKSEDEDEEEEEDDDMSVPPTPGRDIDEAAEVAAAAAAAASPKINKPSTPKASTPAPVQTEVAPMSVEPAAAASSSSSSSSS